LIQAASVIALVSLSSAGSPIETSPAPPNENAWFTSPAVYVASPVSVPFDGPTRLLAVSSPGHQPTMVWVGGCVQDDPGSPRMTNASRLIMPDASTIRIV
jgi:hypothetical protein